MFADTQGVKGPNFICRFLRESDEMVLTTALLTVIVNTKLPVCHDWELFFSHTTTARFQRLHKNFQIYFLITFFRNRTDFGVISINSSSFIISIAFSMFSLY